MFGSCSIVLTLRPRTQRHYALGDVASSGTVTEPTHNNIASTTATAAVGGVGSRHGAAAGAAVAVANVSKSKPTLFVSRICSMLLHDAVRRGGAPLVLRSRCADTSSSSSSSSSGGVIRG